MGYFNNPYFYIIMRKIVLYSLVLLCVANESKGQHYTIKNFLSTELTFPTDFRFESFSYKIKDTVAYIVLRQSGDSTTTLALTAISTNTGSIISHDTIVNLSPNFKIRDILVSQRFLMLTGKDQFVYYDTKAQPVFKNTLNDKHYLNYENVELLNDSLLLLYRICNFHPASGQAGLHMNVIKISDLTVIHKRIVPFPSVLLASMSKKWVTIANNRIIAVAPLTGVLSIYDFELNEQKNETLNICDSQFKANESKEAYYDSLFNNENIRLANIINKYPIDSITNNWHLVRSELHSKGFIGNAISEIRQQHISIEKMYSINDSILLFSVSKPSYAFSYRDVYYYNVKTHTIIKSYTRWPISIQSTIDGYEDVCPINLALDNSVFPTIGMDYAIVCSLLCPDKIEYGSKDAVTADIMMKLYSEGYRLKIVKYKIN